MVHSASKLPFGSLSNRVLISSQACRNMNCRMNSTTYCFLTFIHINFTPLLREGNHRFSSVGQAQEQEVSENYPQGIFPTLLACRPPSKGVLRNITSIS